MLHIHRADRADGLVEALRELLADPPGDPFAPEVVAVPTRGIERWITQRLSTRLGTSAAREDGVCANVLFPSPWRLVVDAVATASGVEAETDPWLPERAVWTLLDVVDDSIGEPWLGLLAAHLGGDPATADPLRRARRFATVRHLAGLLDRYALHRPDEVRAWAETPAAPGDHWQAQLWRRLRARIGEPGPAERLQAACARLQDEPEVLDLPERISLFGLTRLPAGHRDVLAALAERRDVHLFLLHPSPALWDAVAREVADAPAVVRRADDPTATLPENRVLASWGRDAREMQLVLAGATGERVDHHHPVEHVPDTLLARIQADVRADRPPPALPLGDDPDERPLLQPGDRSLEVHACHGRARQVEVLRDAVLHMLQDDPSLEPRDVIVMCPDIETFAPLIHATFGTAAPADDDDDGALPPGERPPDLRVRLADRALRQTNPLLGVVAELLELAHGRVTASQVLDLAGRDPVRRRFRLDDDDLVRLEEWVTESGIRWGLDAPHREPFGLEELRQGTWDHGVARVLVGVTMTEDDRRLVDGVLPLDDVDSGAIDLAGRFAELVDRLGTALDELASPKPVEAWTAAIGRAADLLADPGPRDAWQRAELQRILDDVAGEAAGNGTALALAEVRALLAERLEGRPTRANFRTGHLTICTLVPMRSVPHRVVCLLGLDDAVFPRKAPRDGDDLMLDDARVGERDPRAEDRQLLLDALMAAQERLLITFTGNDERTNAARPPAVPVGELLDVADRTVRTADGKPARDHIVVRHPLQPFDWRNFTAGELAGTKPWSFDRVTLAGARALKGGRADPPPFLAEPLGAERSPVVALDDLVRFVQHPVRAFLRGRLGLSLGDFSTEVDDALPVDLDGLEKWDIGQRLLDARLDGCDVRAAYRAEIARGHLPPGLLGKPVIDSLLPTVEDLVAATEAEAGAQPGETIDVRVALDDGRTVTGTVAGACGDALVTTTFSRVAPKHRLAAWVRLLAVSASAPEVAHRAVTIGRSRSGDGIAVATVPPLMADAATRGAFARSRLAALVDLYDRALCEPLPIACKATAAYARALRDGGDADAAAREAWEGTWNWPGEADEPEHVLAFGPGLSFDELCAEDPRDDERGPGWEPAEATRFGRYAARLWTDVLDVEEVENR